MHIVPVFLAGGTGSRLLPLSTPELPKQFLTLTGHYSMLQQSVLRVRHVHSIMPPVIVTNQQYIELVAEQLTAIGVEDYMIIAEPCSRNTAPAIALAAHYINAYYPEDTVMLVKPTDQVIDDASCFCSLVGQMVSHTDEHIILFGTTPTTPSTQYGYIEVVPQQLLTTPPLVSRFVEKPTKVVAQELIKNKNIFWNCGIFLMQAKVFLAELKKYADDIHTQVIKAYDSGIVVDSLFSIDEASFSTCRSSSIDKAVMEFCKILLLSPLQTSWSDLGCWEQLETLHPTAICSDYVKQ